jgi:hypothetical protein
MGGYWRKAQNTLEGYMSSLSGLEGHWRELERVWSVAIVGVVVIACNSEERAERRGLPAI